MARAPRAAAAPGGRRRGVPRAISARRRAPAARHGRVRPWRRGECWRGGRTRARAPPDRPPPPRRWARAAARLSERLAPPGGRAHRAVTVGGKVAFGRSNCKTAAVRAGGRVAAAAGAAAGGAGGAGV